MGGFLHEYTEILTDPAHFLAEITNSILIDVVFFGMAPLWFRRFITKTVDRKIRAEHALLDAEHGVVNHGLVTPSTPPTSHVTA